MKNAPDFSSDSDDLDERIARKINEALGAIVVKFIRWIVGVLAACSVGALGATVWATVVYSDFKTLIRESNSQHEEAKAANARQESWHQATDDKLRTMDANIGDQWHKRFMREWTRRFKADNPDVKVPSIDDAAKGADGC